MGGYLALTIRTPNNKVVKKTVWTNSTPCYIDNKKLYLKDEKHIQSILDLEQCGNEKLLAPSEYGITVIDCVNNVIIDRNYYHRFGFMDLIQIHGETRATNISDSAISWGGFEERMGTDAFTTPFENEAKRFYELYKDGRCKNMRKFTKKGESILKVPQNLSVEKIAKFIEKYGDNLRYSIILDTSPFKLYSLYKTEDAFKEIGKYFNFSKKEKLRWDKEIKAENKCI